jgi:hypothetical protein
MPLLWEGISVSRSSSWLSCIPYAHVSLPGFPCTLCSWLLIAYCLLPNTYCLLPIACRCRCYVSRQDQVDSPLCRVVNFESSSPIIAPAYSAPVPAYCLHVLLLLHGFANTSPMLLHRLSMSAAVDSHLYALSYVYSSWFTPCLFCSACAPCSTHL